MPRKLKNDFKQIAMQCFSYKLLENLLTSFLLTYIDQYSPSNSVIHTEILYFFGDLSNNGKGLNKKRLNSVGFIAFSCF